MPWNDRHSPLDYTLATLEQVSFRIRHQLMNDEPPTRDDLLAVALILEHLTKDLKPLQELQIKERQ
jgi:hypothetical protein